MNQIKKNTKLFIHGLLVALGLCLIYIGYKNKDGDYFVLISSIGAAFLGASASMLISTFFNQDVAKDMHDQQKVFFADVKNYLNFDKTERFTTNPERLVNIAGSWHQ